MTAPRLIAAMAALFITLRLPLPVAAHDSHATSIQHPHPGRALSHADAQTYPILAARDAAASPEDGTPGTSDSMLALLTAAYIEKRAAEASSLGLTARQDSSGYPVGFPTSPDVISGGSGSSSGGTQFDPYAGAPLGSNGLSDILPPPSTWSSDTWPQKTTAEAEIKTDAPSGASSTPSSAVTSSASSASSQAATSHALSSLTGILTAPAPRPTTIKTRGHQSSGSTLVTGIGGKVVPTTGLSTGISTAARATVTPTVVTTAPAKESTGAAASLVMAGAPGGIVASILLSLGLWVL